jgi:hypothetical protein
MRTELKPDLRFSPDREPVRRTGSNVYMQYFFGEPDRFSHTTQIRFSEFSVLVPLVLLLT